MGKITSDFERFLYANYPDDYRRATVDDVADDVITAILSKHHFHYDVWKSIPEWIRAEYRDDIPQEVLNGNKRVDTFIYEEYDKLTYDEKDKAKEEEEREAREIAFVANLTVSLLAAGYSIEAVKGLSDNYKERKEILKQMAIYGRTPELVAAHRATRERDVNIISNEYDGNKKLVHKKVLRTLKELNRMKVSKKGYDKEEYKRLEEKLRTVMAYVASDTVANKKLAKHFDEPVARSALRHLVPEVKELFETLMDQAGLLNVMQEAIEADNKARLSSKIAKSISESRKNDVEAVKKQMEQTPEKNIIRYVKVLGCMQKSEGGYDEKEYAIMEGKLKEAIAVVANDDKLKKDLVKQLKSPSSQSALHILSDELREQFITSMKDIGILIVPNDENTKEFKINRITLSEGLMKDYEESKKLGKILTNKMGYKSDDFVKDKSNTKSKDGKMLVKSKGDGVSLT